MNSVVSPLGLGIIGLGPLWQGRWRRAVLASRLRFTVHVVTDAVHAIAEHEAQRLHCDAAEGITDLLQRPGLDAVLLVDAAWHGLWPLEQAVRHQKPVLSIPALDADPQHVERVLEHLKQAEARVHFALPWRYTPATIRLRRLLRSRLGKVKLLLCQSSVAGTSGHLAAIDWCLHLMQTEPLACASGFNSASLTPEAQARVSTEPTRVQSVHSESIRTLLLDFPGGATAQVSLIAGADRPLLRAAIHAEHGQVRIRHPNRLSWRSHQTTNHLVLVSERTVEERVLRRFHGMVISGQPDHSSIAAVQAAYGLL